MSSTYKTGDLVWAKLKGISPWPGRICLPLPDMEFPKHVSQYRCVRFFGTQEYGWVKLKHLTPYKKFKDKMMRYCSTASMKMAINQIEEYIKNSEKRKSKNSSIKNGVDNSDDAADEPSSIVATPGNISKMVNPRVLIERIKIYECDTCSLCFLRPEECAMHKLTHVQRNLNNNNDSSVQQNGHVKKYKCEECDAMFVLKSTLTEHLVVHAPFPYVCDCGIGYYRLIDFNGHRKLIHPNETDPPKANNNGSKDEKRKQKGTGLDVASKKLKLSLKEEPELIKKNVIDSKAETSAQKNQQTIKTKLGLATQSKKHKPKSRKTWRDVLKGHSIIMDKDNRYKCPICDKTFTVKRSVSVHIRRHTGDLPYKCDQCNKSYLYLSGLAVHLKIHAGIKDFICKYCGKAFFTVRNLTTHERIHTGTKPYACPVCDKRFTQSGTVKIHLKRHMGINDFQCRYCDKAFPAKCSLDTHERTHTGFKPFVCKYCEKAFSDQSAYRRHIRIHTGEKPYVCTECSKSFSDYSAYAVHKRRHTGVKAFICKICDKKFYNQSALRCHIISVHSSKKAYECHDCGKKFALKHYLLVHIRSVHFSEKKYECHYCGNKFVLKANLVTHIRGMHGNKTFECHHCGMSFSLKGRLAAHITKKHIRKLTCECHDCGKKFYAKEYLVKHIHSNHSVTMYCNVCMKTFVYEKDFLKHKKSCVASCRCDVCGIVCRGRKGLRYHQRKSDCNKYLLS